MSLFIQERKASMHHNPTAMYTVLPSHSRIIFSSCQFLSRVSTLTRDIDIAILSVCLSVRPSVRSVPVLDENGLVTYCHSFFPNPDFKVRPFLDAEYLRNG